MRSTGGLIGRVDPGLDIVHLTGLIVAIKSRVGVAFLERQKSKYQNMPPPPPVPSNSATAVVSLKKQFASLLGATLETWAHELLYVRRVYPSETFGSSRFLGIRCHINRHPEVVSYIQDSIQTAVPAILSRVADEISMVIVVLKSDQHDDDQDETTQQQLHEVERYTIRVMDMAREWNEQQQVAAEVMRLMERSMRDLILKVIGISSGKASMSDLVSFKITLHIPEENASCAELNAAFSNGTWHDANSGVVDTTNTKGRVVRPLYQSTNPACTISLMRLAGKPEQSDRGKKRESEQTI